MKIRPDKDLVAEVLTAVDAILAGKISPDLVDKLGSAAAFLETPQTWENATEKVYGCEYQGQIYCVVYDKGEHILHITRNLTKMRENVHLIGIEKRLAVENLIVYFPPNAKPFSMDRVRQIEYI